MKKILVITGMVASLVVATFSQVSADTFVDWSAQGSAGIQLANATPLPIGDNVYLVGLQSGRNEANVTADFATSIALVFTADLKIYATGQIGDGTGTAGVFAESGDSSSDNTFLGLQMYYVAINSTTPVTATQMGMWKAAGNPNWIWPDTSAQPPANKKVNGLEDANASVLGSLGAAGANDWGYTTAGQTAPSAIPEPSTIVLVGFGLLGAIRLVRSRRS
jgi:hypothetical protein